MLHLLEYGRAAAWPLLGLTSSLFVLNQRTVNVVKYKLSYVGCKLYCPCAQLELYSFSP